MSVERPKEVNFNNVAKDDDFYIDEDYISTEFDDAFDFMLDYHPPDREDE